MKSQTTVVQCDINEPLLVTLFDPGGHRNFPYSCPVKLSWHRPIGTTPYGTGES
jgi:hypothetical protein